MSQIVNSSVLSMVCKTSPYLYSSLYVSYTHGRNSKQQGRFSQTKTEKNVKNKIKCVNAEKF